MRRGQSDLSPRQGARRRGAKARLPDAIKSVGAGIRELVADQHDRWALWPPVAMAFGAAWWIAVPQTPPVWLAGGILLGAGAPLLLVLFSGGGPWRRALSMFLLLCLGFGVGALAAQVRTAVVESPRLQSPLGPVRLTGWVVDVEPGAARARMRVLVDGIEGVEVQLRYVRVSTLADDVWSPGRSVSCQVLLRPPEAPLAPGAYDFARRAYFQRLGATAFSLGRCRPGPDAPPAALGDRAMLYFSAVRRDLSESITTAIPGEGGAISAAMVTGDRSLMSDTTNVVFRDSGLGHLLSVSGLHMALAAGGLYAALHFLLALVPPLALRFPIRKWAAAVALVAAFAYLVLSGLSVPAQRAFVMTAVGFGAILLDRPAFTLRALAVALVAVVALAPESVVDPGFQMSFAATAALIAAFEGSRPDLMVGANPGLLLGGLAASWRNLSGMMRASLVAGLATDPFALFHFQRLSVYGLAANLVATPIITFIVAPSALAAAVLAPIGHAQTPLWLMGQGLDLVRAVGAVFAERPESVLSLPAPPAESLLATVIGIAWLCFWRGPVRWIGLTGFALAGILYASAARPVIWADGDLRAVVALAPDRWIAIGDQRRMTFARGRLAGMAGLDPVRADRLSPPDGCDKAMCLWRTPGGRHAMRVFTLDGLERACLQGAIILADVPLPLTYRRRCQPDLAADPGDLARHGGLSIAETKNGLRVKRVRDRGSQRPWSGSLRRSDE